jgi:alpha-methylacyl-CoA racemase
MTGPLSGRRIVELAGVGPAPFACMLLSDMGADVIRVDRPGGTPLPVAAPLDDLYNRGKRSIVLDLKRPEGVETALALAKTADAVVRAFAPASPNASASVQMPCGSATPARSTGG